MRKQQIGSAMAVLVLGFSGLLIALPGTAGADTSSASSSSPTTGTPTSCSSSGTATVTSTNTTGNPVTGSLTATCTFADNGSVAINNSGVQQTTTADGSGNLTITFNAYDPTISIDNGPIETAQYGVNTITATGPNASGGTNTATFLIDLVNGDAAVAPSTSSGTGTNSSNGLAFTGADLAALVAAALALILMGTGVVIYTRRRAAAVR